MSCSSLSVPHRSLCSWLWCSYCRRRPMSPSRLLPRAAKRVGQADVDRATLLNTDYNAHAGRGRTAQLHPPLGGFLLNTDYGAHVGRDVAEHLAMLMEAQHRLPRLAPWHCRLAPRCWRAVSFFSFFDDRWLIPMKPRPRACRREDVLKPGSDCGRMIGLMPGDIIL